MMSKGILPCRPYTVLFVLLRAESTDLNATNREGISYGYITQHFVQKRMEDSRINGSYDLYYHILSCLSYELVVVQRVFGEFDFISWLQQYVQERLLSADALDLMEDIRSTGLLLIGRESVVFRYSAHKSYFYAKYISDNIRSPRKHEEAEVLTLRVVDEIHDREASNVILFLLYHSNLDSYFINTLKNKASNILNSYEEYDLGNLPGPHAVTTKLLDLSSAYDDVERGELISVNKDSKVEHSELIRSGVEQYFFDINRDMNAAWKCVNILGVVLRSSIGSMEPEDKKILYDMQMSLCLRNLTLFGGMLSSCLKNKDFVSFIDEKNLTKEY